MRRVIPGLVASLIAIVAVGAAYEFAVALGAIGLGPQPGDAPAWDGPVVLLAIGALLLTGVVLLVASMLRRPAATWRMLAVPAAGAAAAAFLVARFYSYDPYYAPFRIRMADGGIVAGWWVAFLVVGTLVAGILVRRWPRAASAGTAVGAWAIALTAFAAGLGH